MRGGGYRPIDAAGLVMATHIAYSQVGEPRLLAVPSTCCKETVTGPMIPATKGRGDQGDNSQGYSASSTGCAGKPLVRWLQPRSRFPGSSAGSNPGSAPRGRGQWQARQDGRC